MAYIPVISGKNRSKSVGTKEYTQAIIAALKVDTIAAGNLDKYRKPTLPSANKMMVSSSEIIETVGIDLFVESEQQANIIAAIVQSHLDSDMELTTITNRGTQVWPEGSVFTDLVEILMWCELRKILLK